MSQSSTIFNANSNSAFYQALKSRKSATGQNGCKLLYFAEGNECAACKTKVETFSSNTANYSAKVVFELPNFQHLSECFLKTTFGKIANTSGTNAACLTENAGMFLWSTIKLVADGVEIARITPEYLCAKYYKHSNDAKRRHLQQLVHGWKPNSLDTALLTTSNKDSVIYPEQRADFGSQVVYTPLSFWFSALEENPNRNVPLGSLDRIFLEVEVNDKAYVNNHKSTSTQLGCPIESMSIVSYITELEHQEEAMWRASSLAVGETMTQIGRNIVQHSEGGIVVADADAAAGFKDHTIKLNMINGQISRLYVVITPEATDGPGAQQVHFAPQPLKKCSLHANGVEVYKMESLADNENLLEDWINKDYDCVSQPGLVEAGTKADDDMGAGWSAALHSILEPTYTTCPSSAITTNFSGTTSDANFAEAFTLGLAASNAVITQKRSYTSSIDPKHIYVMSFKNVGSDQRGTSATGSINFSNLSSPELKISLNALAGNVYGGVACAAGNASYKCVVIAEQLTMVSYGVNNAGRVSLRMVN